MSDTLLLGNFHSDRSLMGHYEIVIRRLIAGDAPIRDTKVHKSTCKCKAARCNQVLFCLQIYVPAVLGPAAAPMVAL